MFKRYRYYSDEMRKSFDFFFSFETNSLNRMAI